MILEDWPSRNPAGHARAVSVFACSVLFFSIFASVVGTISAADATQMDIMPTVTPVSPADGAFVEGIPSLIVASFTRGSPALDPQSAHIQVNGVPMPTTIHANDTITAVAFGNVPLGRTSIVAQVYFLTYVAVAYWNFTITEWLVPHEDAAGFILPVPHSWTLTEDKEIGGAVYEIQLTGSAENGVVPTIIVDTDVDGSVREDNEYLNEQVETFLAGLGATGSNVSVLSGPKFVKIANHSAVEIIVLWVGLQVEQKLAIVVSEEHDRYWLFLLTSSLQTSGVNEGLFDKMLDGFTITLKPKKEIPALQAIVLAAAIGGGAGAAGWYLIRRNWSKKRSPKPPKPVISPAPGISGSTGYCPNCQNQEPLTSRTCSKCGASLPSPPFGGIVTPPPQRQ